MTKPGRLSFTLEFGRSHDPKQCPAYQWLPHKGERICKESSWVLPYKTAGRGQKPFSMKMTHPKKGGSRSKPGKSPKKCPRAQGRRELITRPQQMDVYLVLAPDQIFFPLIEVKVTMVRGNEKKQPISLSIPLLFFLVLSNLEDIPTNSGRVIADRENI